MKKLAILASVVVLAVASANCSNSHEQGGAGSVFAPSDLGGGATDARGGGGGKKGGGTTTGGSGSLTLVMVTDNNGNGQPNWGDTVTFNVSTTATTEPTVNLNCSQNGVGVYGATAGFYAGYPWPWTVNMTLSSTAWSSGAADCTATLTALGSSTALATLNFTAGS
jgi:hypothetical protein